MIKHLNWTRYWIPVLSQDQMQARSTAQLETVAARTTAELDPVRCLVMLGLPGMGKTSEMRLLARGTEESGAYSEFISLGLVPNEAELERRLLDSPGRIAWAEGRRWVIHLDGLDEAIIEHDELIATLNRSLRIILADLASANAPAKQDRLNRLTIRISCRAAEWPSSLSSDLSSLFGDGFEMVQLQELQREDAESAAEQSGIESQAWRGVLDQLESISTDALARRPITLGLLLSTYEQTREVPTRQVPLYHRGVLALLEESNEIRLRNKLVGRLDTSSRLLVASRIAAATTFSNSTSVSLSARNDAGDAETVLVSEIAGGLEALGGQSFQVGEPEIIELLRTGLFSPLSETKFTWAHRTFSEFLAAYYLSERGLSTDQLIEFLGSSQDPKKRIPPQLHEVAAWVASMRQDFFRALVTRQPTILLSSDVAGASDEDRSKLVKQLLEDFDKERIFDTDWELRRRYSKLRHPGLRDDLLPYITGRNHSLVARRNAIQIAVESDEKSLAGHFASIALDGEEDLHLRAQAVIAVGKLGEAELRSKLKPLALPGDPADRDDELKGWSLAALWPDLISFEQLLQALTPRRRTNFLGGYWRFRRDLELRLTPEEAVKAVNWVRGQAAERSEEDLSDCELPVTMLAAAWKNAGDDRVIEAFAEFALAANSGEFARLLYSSEFAEFSEAYSSENDEYRHRLATRVIGDLSQNQRAGRLWIYGRWPLLIPRDVPWLLSQLEDPDHTLPTEAVIETVIALLYFGGLDGRDDVWKAAETNTELANALTTAFTVDLNSDVAQFHQKRKERLLEDGEEPAFDLRNEVDKRLTRSRAHVEEWWTFNLLFFVDERGRSRGDEFNTDLTSQSVWRSLTPAQKATTVAWAQAYLTQDTEPQRDWLGTNTFHRPAAAAYRAFRLLMTEATDRFDKLPATAWARWSHAILGVSSNDDNLERKIRSELVARAYSMAPRHFLHNLARVLLRAGAEYSIRETLDRLDHAYDERIAQILYKIAGRKKTPAGPRLDILKFLVSRNYAPVRGAIVSEFFEGNSGNELSFERTEAIALAGEFLFKAPHEAWPYLVELDQRDPDLAREVFLAAHSSHSFGSFPIADFGEADLRDLYLWIDARFPASDDEWEGGARWIGPDEQVQHTHRAILNQLEQRGTSAAVEAVRDLTTQLPEQTWLKWRLAEAEAAFQVRAWRSRSPGGVLRTLASYSVTPPLRSAKEDLKAAASELLASSEPPQSPNVLVAPEVDVAPPTTQAGEAMSILSVATEWTSAHGGLSTLNRDLCVALTREGHKVACLVLDANEADILDANSHAVQLISCPNDAGVDGLDRLFIASLDALQATEAQFVIGHDHITGPPAHHIAKRVLKASYVHFVHTIPDEIEAFKSPDLYQSLAKGADKAEVQLKQCKQADLVVAVGPRIFWEIANKVGSLPPVMQLRPGLVTSLLSQTRDAATLFPVNVLFQGRLENPELKGARLAFEATARLRQDSTINVWDRPTLVMRGFEKEHFEEQCKVLGDEQGIQTFVKPRFFTTDGVALAADLSSASLLLMPSMKEGFGLIALEAISAGIPVLISTSSGIAELLHKDPDVVGVIDSKTAQLAVCDVEGPPDAVAAAWSDQMREILADREAAFQRAEQLRVDLSGVLTWRNAARSLIAQLRKASEGQYL